MEKLIDKIYQLSFLVFAALVVFPQKVSSTALVVFISAFIIKKIFDTIHGVPFFARTTKETIPSRLLLILFISELLTATYAAEPNLVAQRMFGQRLTLLGLPLIALLNPQGVNLHKGLKSFVIGNFLFMSMSVVFLLYTFGIRQEPTLHFNFFNSITPCLTGLQHRSYAGLNAMLSLIALYQLYKENQLTQGWKHLPFAHILLTLGFITINNSRAVTLAFVGLVLILMISLFINHQTSRKKIWVIPAIVLLIPLLLFSALRTSDFIRQTIQTHSINDPRQGIWPAATELIKEHPVFGLGVNNYATPLIQKYAEKEFSEGFTFRYNTHNQFLGTTLETGVIGLLLLLAILIAIPLCCPKERRITAIAICALFSLLFFFESMLERYAGCVSFAFVLTLPALCRQKSANPKRLPSWVGWTTIATTLMLTAGILVCHQVSRQEKTACVYDKSIYYPVDPTIQEELQTPPGIVEIATFDNSLSFKIPPTLFAYQSIGAIDLPDSLYGIFNIHCYVTEDFNADWVKIIAEKLVDGFSVETAEFAYDMNRRNTWQHLGIPLSSERQIVNLYVGSSLERKEEMHGKIFFSTPLLQHFPQ